MRFGMVVGAGGERAVSWEIGVLAGLADAGMDPRHASIVQGTSAGALLGARFLLGEDPRDRADRLVGRVDHLPTRRCRPRSTARCSGSRQRGPRPKECTWMSAAV
jgi:predicted acylesterase/phospholipase RssA